MQKYVVLQRSYPRYQRIVSNTKQKKKLKIIFMYYEILLYLLLFFFISVFALYVLYMFVI